ncbi:hypothetical protein UFOVP323_30 [uncultured Caudovirales phage]|uniref:Methyltransferase domain containing protein n=1 Tax=uncultured Caudovirales phage TaxID=2100421 RepID=A0A6J5M0H7_9CAUD|nr:hypothetical protein UFOVP323_30 [uncultured Caudovirales phage]
MIETSPNMERCDLPVIKPMVEKYGLTGDIIEFGTFSCESALFLASQFPDKKIYTIDHFLGLEESNKSLPASSNWTKGQFALGHPDYQAGHIPKNIEEAKEKLSRRDNIELILSDVHDLTHPNDYGIGKLAAANVDVDIYEPTVSSLEFLTKCEWNEIFIRFDDWHGNEVEYDEHERLAFIEWIEKYNYQYEITHGGYIGGVFVKR